MSDAIVATERDTRILQDSGRRGVRAISKGCEMDECWRKVAGGTVKIVYGTKYENEMQKKEKIFGENSNMEIYNNNDTIEYR